MQFTGLLHLWKYEVQEQSKDQSLRTHVSTCKSKRLCACMCRACMHSNMCVYHGLFKQTSTIAKGWTNHQLSKEMNEWMDGWMLKAKMVQKACGDWRLDKLRWEKWWTVAQTSAAFIPIFLYDLSNILIWVSIFCIQTKETKQRINQLKSPKQCCNWWDMADVQEDDSQMVCSPAVPTSVVSYRCKHSAQADCDVGVERPPGH